MTRRARALAAALASIVAGLAAAVPAHAVDCASLTLTDPAGFDWTFQDDADARAADHDGFDRVGSVYFDDNFASYYDRPAGTECALEDGGREVVWPVQAVSGLEVHAKAYVPSGGSAFVRHVWFFRNTNSFPRRIHVRRWSDTEYATTAIRATSSGDLAVTPADDWFTFDNSADAAVPTSGLVWQGPGGRRTAAEALYEECCDGVRAPIENGFDEPQVRYQAMDVGPGETAALMQFAVARATREGAEAAARELAGAPPEALAGMADDEVRAVRNFLFPDHDRDGAPNEADNCLFAVNGDQADADGDRAGDACDEDDDADGLGDALEASFRTDPRRADTDGDGRNDREDACPTTRGTSEGCPRLDGPGGGGTTRYVGRVTPRSATAALARRVRRYTATGAVLPPDGLSAAEACSSRGLVELRARKGRRTVARRRARLRPDCTYAVSARVAARGRLRLTVRWLGNKYLKPEAIRSFTRRLG